MSQSRTVVARAGRTSLVLVVTLVLALVTGCGVRLETPPPAAPTPDAREAARQRAAADAVALGVLAGADGSVADPTTDPATDPATDPVAAARAAVASDARVHLELLGGVHDDEGDDTTSGASPAPGPDVVTPAPSAVAEPDVLASRLTEAAATARADAATVDDGPLARLLGSVAVNRMLSAARLAAAAGLTAPPVPAVVLPEALPEGVAPADVEALVASEDAAGYALEVVAARHGGDLRGRAGDRARVHRARGQAWAELAGIDGTGLDPRRVAYALPDHLDDPATAAAVAHGLETSLAAHYAGLLAAAPPEARATLVDAVAEATAASLAWGAPLPALPGLPEHAGG